MTDRVGGVSTTLTTPNSAHTCVRIPRMQDTSLNFVATSFFVDCLSVFVCLVSAPPFVSLPVFLHLSVSLLCVSVDLSLSWADVGEDKHAKVSLAFLRRKNRLGMMVKLLTKLISSSSKVGLTFMLHLAFLHEQAMDVEHVARFLRLRTTLLQHCCLWVIMATLPRVTRAHVECHSACMFSA